MTVETPPVAADPALPHLDAALTPVVAARAIGAAKHFAGAEIAIRSAVLVRHKPGRRAVLAYTMDVAWPDGRVERVPAIAKMRAARPPRTAYRLLRALWRGGFSAASPDGISVPEPLGVVPALGLWLQRRVEGPVATDLLATPAGPVLARRVAAAAFKLHHAGIAPEKAHGPAAELAILERVIAEGRRVRPDLSAGCDRLLDGCRRLAGALADPVTAIHRDFYADQIVVDGERLVLLDFDLYCEDTPDSTSATSPGTWSSRAARAGARHPARGCGRRPRGRIRSPRRRGRPSVDPRLHGPDAGAARLPEHGHPRPCPHHGSRAGRGPRPAGGARQWPRLTPRRPRPPPRPSAG
ncbi:MAG: hypothetical protein R2708_09375 [Vicinamibacterales bacterium]